MSVGRPWREARTSIALQAVLMVIGIVEAAVLHDAEWLLITVAGAVAVLTTLREVRRKIRWAAKLHGAAQRLADNARTPDEQKLARLCMTIAEEHGYVDPRGES